MRQSTAGNLRIRAHHLLCMFGFRGLGYSPDFVRNMRSVVDAFFSESGADVQVVAACDDICRACPHLRDGRCAARPDSEAQVKAKDELVLARLGLSPGDRRHSSALARLVADNVTPSALMDICAGCQWLPAGCCTEGLGRAANRRAQEAR